MTPNLTELRKLAEEARDSKCNCSFYARGPHPAPTDIANLGRAANPATILALLNLVEELRKALDDLSTRCDCNELCACASDMMATAREALTPKPSLSTPNPEREEGGR